MKLQITEITKNGNKFIQMPFSQYETLLEMIEEAEDIEAVREAKLSNETTYPAEVIFSIIEGKNPVLAYREFAKLTQQQLADKVGISRVMISEIESGKKSGSIKTIKLIAKVLNVDINMLVI